MNFLDEVGGAREGLDGSKVGLDLGQIGLEILGLVKRGKLQRDKAGIGFESKVGSVFELPVNQPTLGKVFLIMGVADGALDEGGLQRFGFSHGVLGGGASLEASHDAVRLGGGGCGHLAQLPMINPGMRSQRIPLAKKRETTSKPATLPYLAKRFRMRTVNIR